MATSNNSIHKYITAPAPRFVLRLFVLDKLFAKYISGSNKSFLEIGPGRGDVCAYLIEHPSIAKGTAVDLSDKSVEILKSRFKKTINLEIFCHDIAHNNLDGSFDYIVACEVLEHIDDDVGFLKKINALLNPNGYLFLSVPAYMKKWQKQDVHSGHVRRYEKAEIQEKLSDAGLVALNVLDYGFPLTTLLYPFRQLYYKDDENRSKIEKTKSSGTERALFSKVSPDLSLPLYYPFALIQRLFYKFEFGDGLIIVATKK